MTNRSSTVVKYCRPNTTPSDPLRKRNSCSVSLGLANKTPRYNATTSLRHHTFELTTQTNRPLARSCMRENGGLRLNTRLATLTCVWPDFFAGLGVYGEWGARGRCTNGWRLGPGLIVCMRAWKRGAAMQESRSRPCARVPSKGGEGGGTGVDGARIDVGVVLSQGA